MGTGPSWQWSPIGLSPAELVALVTLAGSPNGIALEAPPLGRRQARLRALWATMGLTPLVAELKRQADRYWGLDATVSLALADAIALVGGLAGAPQAAALGAMARADALRFLGRFSESVPFFDKAAQLFRDEGDEVGWARTRIGNLLSCLYLGRLTAAQAEAETAGAIFRDRGEWLYAARIENNLALVASAQGDRRTALARYRRAVEFYQQADPPPQIDIEWTRNNVAVMLTHLGHLDEALAIVIETQPRLLAAGAVMWAALADAERARIHLLRGEYTLAWRLYRETCPILRRHGRAVEAAITENNLVRCLLRLNLYDEAVDQADATLATLDESPGDRAETLALRSQARGLMLDFSGALADLDQAEASLGRLGLGPHQAAIELQRAEIYWAEGALRQGARAALRAARLFVRHQHLIYRWVALLMAAQSLEGLGRRRATTRIARAYLTSPEAGQLAWLAQIAHQLLGRCADADGQHELAIDHFTRAIDALEQVGSRLLMDLRGHYLTDKLAVYRDAVATCLTHGDEEAAFRFAERARGRALVEHLANHVDIRVKAHQATDQPLVDELTALRRERSRYVTMLEAIAGGRLGGSDSHAPDELTEAEDRLATIERRIAELWKRLQARHPAYSQAGGLAAPLPESPQSSIPSGTLLISYFESREGLLAFAADDSTLTVHPLPMTLPAVEQLLGLLWLNFERIVTHSPGSQAEQQLTDQANQLLGALYQGLIAPCAGRMTNRQRLLIVPHGPLHYVPFVALHDGAGYLCERVALAVLPSAAWLGQAATLSPPATPPSTRAAPPSTRASTTDSPAGADRAITRATTPVLVMAHSQGGLLPETLTEAAAVARLFGAEPLLEEAASYERLERDGAQATIIHLATHAGYRPDAPLFSSIFLADRPCDLVDIFNLRLTASLVTLSACETGRSSVLAGDELVGLSRAFLYAGARSLLLSLWRIEDTTTRRLMERFYGALQHGETKDEALRQAQAEAATAGEHPYFWAAFVLIGAADRL